MREFTVNAVSDIYGTRIVGLRAAVPALATLRGCIVDQSRKMLGKKAASAMAIQNTASPALGFRRIAGTNRGTARPTVKTMAKG